MTLNMPMCCNSNENYQTTTSSKCVWSYLKERIHDLTLNLLNIKRIK
jgi:hypothetical protein